MKFLILLALLMAIAFGIQIDSGYGTKEECLDPEGKCDRPCHNKFLENGGKCDEGDKYNPHDYNIKDYGY